MVTVIVINFTTVYMYFTKVKKANNKTGVKIHRPKKQTDKRTNKKTSVAFIKENY